MAVAAATVVEPAALVWLSCLPKIFLGGPVYKVYELFSKVKSLGKIETNELLSKHIKLRKKLVKSASMRQFA